MLILAFVPYQSCTLRLIVFRRKSSVVLSKNFELTDIAGENLAIPVGSLAEKYKAVIALSEASAFLLSQLKQPKTSAELVSLLTQEFDVSVEQAEADVKEAVEKYSKLGLITNDDQP